MSPVFADPQLAQKRRVLDVVRDPAVTSFVSRPANHQQNVTVKRFIEGPSTRIRYHANKQVFFIFSCSKMTSVGQKYLQ